MTPAEFNEGLAALGISQRGFARASSSGERTVRGWALGERAIPGPIEVLLWAMRRDPTLLDALRARHP